MSVKTRFAPSPTGSLHVGGLRTALYNFLFAKQHHGKFVFRLEDTDQNRLVKDSIPNLLESLNVCGLKFDEGLIDFNSIDENFQQSKRLDIYHKYFIELIKLNKAYPCFIKDIKDIKNQDLSYDKKQFYSFQSDNVLDRISSGEQFYIRMKVPETGDITVDDYLRGKINFDISLQEDPIIIKSDGFPTYHFANVIDDHLMGITHVIRGEEWLPSMPKHLLLYQYFDWEPPIFIHLPLLLNSDKTKLSKRQGDVAVKDYLNKGFTPDVIINFVALLGWHPSSNKEIFSMNELINEFSIDRINKSGAIFDIKKLNWMNSYYLKNLEIADVINLSKSFENISFNSLNQNRINKLYNFAINRSETLLEIHSEIEKLSCPIKFNSEKQLTIDLETSQKIYQYFLNFFKVHEMPKKIEEINKLITEGSKSTGVKGKDYFCALRLALYGEVHGPEIAELFNVLGKQLLITKLEKASN